MDNASELPGDENQLLKLVKHVHSLESENCSLKQQLTAAQEQLEVLEQCVVVLEGQLESTQAAADAATQKAEAFEQAMAEAVTEASGEPKHTLKASKQVAATEKKASKQVAATEKKASKQVAATEKKASKEVAATEKKAKKTKKKALGTETCENTSTTPEEVKSMSYTKLKKHMLEIGVSQHKANKCANKTALLELFDKHRAALDSK